MRNIHQGLQSTKKRVETDEEADGPPRQTKTHQHVFTCVFDLKDEMQANIYDEMEANIYNLRRTNDEGCHNQAARPQRVVGQGVHPLAHPACQAISRAR